MLSTTPPETPATQRTTKDDHTVPDDDTSSTTPPITPCRGPGEDDHASHNHPSSLPLSDLVLHMATAERELLAFAAHELGSSTDLLVLCPEKYRPIADILMGIASYFQCGRSPATCDFIPMTDRPTYTAQQILEDRAHVTPTYSTYDHVVCFGLPALLAPASITTLLQDWKGLLKSYASPNPQLLLELQWGAETSWCGVARRYEMLAVGTGLALRYVNSRRLHEDETDTDPIWHRGRYGASYGNLVGKLEWFPNPTDDFQSFIKQTITFRRSIDECKYRKAGDYVRPGDKLYGRFEVV